MKGIFVNRFIATWDTFVAFVDYLRAKGKYSPTEETRIEMKSNSDIKVRIRSFYLIQGSKHGAVGY